MNEKIVGEVMKRLDSIGEKLNMGVQQLGVEAVKYKIVEAQTQITMFFEILKWGFIGAIVGILIFIIGALKNEESIEGIGAFIIGGSLLILFIDVLFLGSSLPQIQATLHAPAWAVVKDLIGTNQ